MNRKYTSEKYLGIIHKLRNAIPNIAITTDVMVGFPGETEEDFLQTYNLMKQIRFDYAFTFKYSPREVTAAASYSEQVPEDVRLERLKKLIELQEQITFEKYQEQIGRTVQVYVEHTSKKSDKELSGRTRDNKIAVFPGDKKLIGTFVDIEIIDATGWTLKGKQIQRTKL
jgi:2-methylthioadenine synthetase